MKHKNLTHQHIYMYHRIYQKIRSFYEKCITIQIFERDFLKTRTMLQHLFTVMSAYMYQHVNLCAGYLPMKSQSGRLSSHPPLPNTMDGIAKNMDVIANSMCG